MSVDTEALSSHLSQSIEFESADFSVDETDITWKTVNTLAASSHLSNTDGVKIEMKLYNELSCIARIKFAVFQEDNIGYIHWVHVPPTGKGDNIGSCLFMKVTEFVESEFYVTVYSKIVNDALTEKAKDFGYEQALIDSNWYKYNSKQQTLFDFSTNTPNSVETKYFTTPPDIGVQVQLAEFENINKENGGQDE